jgi:hypothetical protein
MKRVGRVRNKGCCTVAVGGEEKKSRGWQKGSQIAVGEFIMLLRDVFWRRLDSLPVISRALRQ